VKKTQRRLIQCLVLSTAAHAAALSYLYSHPLILQGPFQSLFGVTCAESTPLAKDDSDLTPLQKNELLEEAFQSIIVLSPHFQKPYDMVELAKGISLAPHLEENEELFLAAENIPELSKPSDTFSTGVDAIVLEVSEPSPSALFAAPEMSTPVTSALLIDTEMAPPSFSFEPDSLHEETVDEELPLSSSIALEANYETEDTLCLFAPQGSLKDLTLKTPSEALTAKVETGDLDLAQEMTTLPLWIPPAHRLAEEIRQIPIPQGISQLEEYTFSDLTSTAEWNDDFDIDTTFLPNPEGEGYIFSLALQSGSDLSSHGLRQNLYFVLDRSSSVQKHRFAVFKRATLKALASMQRSDTFNILLIDKKITLFSPENRTATLKNISFAEEFLGKQEAGGFFASCDIYTKLDAILPHIPDNDEVHTILLLTDGKTDMHAGRKQKTLSKWVEKKRAKLSLHACAIGRDNDLLSLDMLCSLSGGKLLYSDTHAAFPRKLARLIIDLKDPIAKELTATALPHHPDSSIQLYPSQTSLYAHQPYIILGQIDKPCSFDLILQGRHRDQWIAIKKTVSFIDGHKGDLTLQKQWKAQQANTCYSDFLKEGKETHLKQAHDILKQTRSEVAFE
jgi:von Willebrand factor type A domain